MDLSFLKWPVIILVVAGGIWLLSEGGVNFMESRFSAGTPGQDANIDKANEAGLSRLGGYLMMTFRYERAARVFNKAIERYPNGANLHYNYYRLARAHERMADGTTDRAKIQQHYRTTISILQNLRKVNAHETDDRVPENDALRLRIEKLAETHELGEVGQF